MMKGLVPIRRFPLLLLSMLFLCGCSSPLSQAPAVPVSPLAGHGGFYTAKFQVTSPDFPPDTPTAGTISQVSPDACTVSFTAPASLEGMAFVFRGSEVETSYRGLTFPFSRGALPSGAAAGVLTDVLGQTVKDEDIAVSLSDDGQILLSGTVDAGEFTLTAKDGETSALKLSVPALELEIALTNFRFLE